MADHPYTNVRGSFWEWIGKNIPGSEPRANYAKLLLIAIFTSPETKAYCPGLYKGSISSMAELTGMLADDVRGALDLLLELDLVEFDAKARCLRMTELPDCSEFPSNGKVIRGWWRGWNNAPDSPIRVAHVSTLRKLLDDWCIESRKTLSDNHQEAWSATFASVVIPVRKRASRRSLQTDLFLPPEPPTPNGTVTQPSSGVDNSSDSCSVRGSASSGNDSQNSGSETVSQTVSYTVSIPLGSGIGSGQGTGRGRGFSFSGAESDRGALGAGETSAVPGSAAPPLTAIGTGDRDREAPAAVHRARPHLALVPDVARPFTADQLRGTLQTAIGGIGAPEIDVAELDRVILSLGREGITAADLELVASWARASNVPAAEARGWLERPASLPEAFAEARAWRGHLEEKLEQAGELSRALAAIRKEAGF